MSPSPKHSEPEGPERNWLLRIIQWCGRLLVGFIIFMGVLWCLFALHYSPLSANLRTVLMVIFVVLSAAVLFKVRPRWLGVLLFCSIAAVVAIFWVQIAPSNDRHWRKDVSVLSSADVKGNLVTIRNVRNSQYKTDTDFELRHYDRTYDLNKLRDVDFYMSFWAQIPFAHTMVSFGFEDGEYVCFSIETRPEENEGYSPIGGAFRQFELVYVVADERDVIRLRTNVRDETVYLYHLVTTPEAKRKLFLRYCDRLNDLYAKPEWYCTLTRNCTTDIPRRDGTEYGWFPESWKIVINGFVDRFLFAQGSLDQRLSLPELRKVGHINTRGQNAGDDPEFSKRIREGIPPIR